ncbi:MAG TPA: sugar ABC transporter permease [Candidatus Limnocylindria bacterium]
MTEQTDVAGKGEAAASLRTWRSAEARTAWLLSTPALIGLTAFIVVPFLLALVLSFTNQRLISPLPTRVIGLENYLSVLADAGFWQGLINNVWFVAIVVPLQTALALFLAVLVNSRIRGRVAFRTVYFVPVVTVMAAAAVTWTLLLNPNGLVNAFFDVISFGTFAPDWLGSTTWALPAVMAVSIWQGTGFQMIILLASLQDVPEELYEAAELDGAGSWMKFLNVTLPGIRNGLIFVVTVTTILAFRLFDQVWIMPQVPGGPLDATRTMMLHLVETGFGAQAIGRASAVAVIFFVLVLALTLIQRRFIREEGGAA